RLTHSQHQAFPAAFTRRRIFMDRKGTWIIAASLLLGFVFCGLSYVMAQRGDGDRLMASGQVGRFQVVRSNEEGIIIIDTTTGDLYKATPGDIKPFNQRPKPDPRLGSRPMGFGDKNGAMDMKGGKLLDTMDKLKKQEGALPAKGDFFPKEKAKGFEK